MREDPKTKIKAAAIKLFATMGFSATSVRQIALEADVNLAAINYHFGSKEGLLEEIFSDFADSNLTSLITVLKKPGTKNEFASRLEMFVELFIKLSIEKPDRFEMVHRNIEHFAEKHAAIFEATFGSLHNAIKSFFITAQEERITRQDVPALMMVQFLMSSLTDIVRTRTFREKLLEFSIEDQEVRSVYTRSLVDCFVNGVKDHG